MTKMLESSSKRKARKDSLTNSLGEREASSPRTENIQSLYEKGFTETSEKIEKSVSRRIRDTETGQWEILRMIENLSSKIDSLSNGTPRVAKTETDDIDPVDLGSAP